MLPRSLVLMVFVAIGIGLGACSSAPKRAEDSVSLAEARSWLERYCSKGPRDLSGSLVFHANTREFKGRHPGTVRVRADGSFTLEATHILGGTLVQIESDGKTFRLRVPSRPRADRSGESEYLGLGIPVFRSLLLGDLPCPLTWKSDRIRIEGSAIVVESRDGVWSFTRAADREDRVPFGVDWVPADESAPGPRKVELRIESWDRAGAYAKKVRVRSPEGDLKWSWRSREP